MGQRPLEPVGGWARAERLAEHVAGEKQLGGREVGKELVRYAERFLLGKSRRFGCAVCWPKYPAGLARNVALSELKVLSRMTRTFR
jgi:hypothetical protein